MSDWYDKDYISPEDYGNYFDDEDDFADNDYYPKSGCEENQIEQLNNQPSRIQNVKQYIKCFFGSKNIVRVSVGRKGLKWKLVKLYNKRLVRLLLLLFVILFLIFIFVSIGSCSKAEPQDQPTTASAAVPPTTTPPSEHRIDGVPVIAQVDIKAACETYAGVMLMQYYDFDIEVSEFVDNYLIKKPVFYGEDGNLYGPDMDAAYAGLDANIGYGINCPAMAKCMNNYLETTDSKLRAYPYKDIPYDTLIKDYIDNDIPVMIWETTYMQEPYVKDIWVVDYVDENSKKKIGDSESWMQNEHCMVFVGYDKDNYYFCDSVAGKLAVYDKKEAEERYKQIGSQIIVLK